MREALEYTFDFIDEVYSVMVLPEGAYSPKEGKLGALHRGVEVLFGNTKVPILPYFISGTSRKSFPVLENALIRRIPHGFSKVTLKIGKPFTLENVKGQKAMKLVQGKLMELSK